MHELLQTPLPLGEVDPQMYSGPAWSPYIVGALMIVGMVGGSYLFAEASGWISRYIDPIGDQGKLTLNDLFPINRTTLVILVIAVLVAVLVAVEKLAAR